MVEFRSIPAAPVAAISETVTAEQAWAWGTGAFEEFYGRIEQAGCAGRPGGALFPAGFFELERAELTAFVPVAPRRRRRAGRGRGPSRARKRR